MTVWNWRLTTRWVRWPTWTGRRSRLSPISGNIGVGTRGCVCGGRSICGRGYWSFDPHYLAQEPTDPENIPFATLITLGALGGLLLVLRRSPREAIRYAGVLLLLPMPYFFTHPEPYHLRALDPVLVMLGCHAVLTWRSRSASHAQQQVGSGESE